MILSYVAFKNKDLSPDLQLNEKSCKKYIKMTYKHIFKHHLFFMAGETMQEYLEETDEFLNTQTDYPDKW